MSFIEQPIGRNRGNYRTAAIAFAAGLTLGLMMRSLTTTAYAQLPDPGQQRIEMSQGIWQVNAQMSELLTLLRTGTLKVRVIEADKTSGPEPRILYEGARPSRGAGPDQPASRRATEDGS